MAKHLVEQPWASFSGPLLRLFMPYVVAMNWLDGLKVARSDTGNVHADYDIQARVTSAFLMEAHGIWMLITAGHVLKAFEQVTAEPRRFVKGRIFDHLGHSDKGDGIPFEFNKEPMYHIDLREVGWDLGAIPLPAHYVRLMQSTHRQAFSQGMIATLEDEFERYVILGFPSEHLLVKRTQSGTKTDVRMRFGTPLLPVRRLKRPPPALKKPLPRFYGKILKDEFDCDGEKITLSDIDGMSGGPIIGIRRRRSGLEYGLVAVQSGWLSSERVVAGCPISDLGDAVIEKMRAAGAKV